MTTEYPEGYCFVPTHLELIVDYLKKRIDGEKLLCNVIREVNVYNSNPDEIADVYKYKPGNGEKMYFFSPKGTRQNRTAGDGYWKALTSAKPICNERNVRVGSLRTYVYKKGEPGKGKKYKWTMQKYTIKQSSLNRTKCVPLVLCVIRESPQKPNQATMTQLDGLKRSFQELSLSKLPNNSNQVTLTHQLNG